MRPPAALREVLAGLFGADVPERGIDLVTVPEDGSEEARSDPFATWLAENTEDAAPELTDAMAEFLADLESDEFQALVREVDRQVEEGESAARAGRGGAFTGGWQGGGSRNPAPPMKNALLPAAVCALALLPSPFAPRAQTTTAQRLPRSTAVTTFVAAADATQAERGAADLRCDGVRDEVELQAAIDALRGRGGRVVLSSGTFRTSAPVEVTGRLHLAGQGLGTVVRAANDFAGTALVTGTYTGQGEPLDLFALSDLTLHGSRFQAVQCGGVLLDVRSQAGFQQGSPDAFVRIADLLVTQCAGHGVHLTGASNRAARVREVRVWDVDGDGFRIECPDAKLTDCDAGSSGGAGFRILGANVLVSGCKGWYSDESGFVIDAVRGSYDGCSAQDNALHGFDVRAGLNAFNGCHADSNSYAGGANPTANAGLYDGFHVAASNVTIAASLAYDKDEGGRGRNQRYGLFVAPGRVRINAQIATGNGSSHDNLVGGVGGAVAGAGTRIVATGQTDLGW